MSEASNIKANLSIPGNDDDKTRSKVFKIPLTFKTVCEWIKVQGLDDYTTDGLIKLASKYPTNALPSFKKNFNLMLSRVRQQRQKELNNKLHTEKIEESNEQSNLSEYLKEYCIDEESSDYNS